MSKPGSTIKLLPVELQLRIKSSLIITSLNDAVVGLIKNSLDAQAQTVHVEVDFARGNCVVEDDGAGIPAAEFEASGGLGLMHCERKLWQWSDKIADSSKTLLNTQATATVMDIMDGFLPLCLPCAFSASLQGRSHYITKVILYIITPGFLLDAAMCQRTSRVLGETLLMAPKWWYEICLATLPFG